MFFVSSTQIKFALTLSSLPSCLCSSRMWMTFWLHQLSVLAMTKIWRSVSLEMVSQLCPSMCYPKTKSSLELKQTKPMCLTPTFMWPLVTALPSVCSSDWPDVHPPTFFLVALQNSRQQSSTAASVAVSGINPAVTPTSCPNRNKAGQFGLGNTAGQTML